MKLRIKHLPTITSTILAVLIIITTSLAFHYEHISSYIPYISDTGTIAPESCIFGQFLNIIWVILSFAMYCKFRQVTDILNKHNMTHKEAFNKYTFIMGLIAGFGISVVGNFQETNCFIVHWLGAVMCFGFGSIYLCMQTSIYLAITPVIGQMVLTKIRIVISALSVITFIIFFISAMVSYTQFKGTSYLHWKYEDGGYELHLISSVTEWLCAASIMTYVMLFKKEFEHTVVHEPIIDTGLIKPNNQLKRTASNTTTEEKKVNRRKKPIRKD
ncbi:DNA damage-regulated autophagy modulator protein 2-like [Diabrotica virgifera virgifera]|uniref:CWH43-like N-terminal domain-containing protein n=1 Tax=Diabrotica virgifera virgifera TaxID=50390 RepID=A0ABM5KIG8_DIAVI|nr:DNA damage-regulated autophagy modulator protein 2-like [Diabrotica virgifera virgifera]